MRKAWIAALAVAVFAIECEDAVRGGSDKQDAGGDQEASVDAGDEPLIADGADAADATESERELTFCETTKPDPIFCDDFEQGPFKEYWDNSNRTPDLGEVGGGKLSLDKIVFASSPNSAQMYTPPIVDPGGGASAILVRSVHAPPKDFMVRFDTIIDTEYLPDGGGKAIHIMSLHFVGQGFFFLFRSTSGTAFAIGPETGGPGALNFLAPAFPVGKWKNIRVYIKNHPLDDSSPDGDVKVQLDVVDAGQSPLPANFQLADEIEVSIGALTGGVTGEFRMNVDNVLFYDRTDL